MKSLLKPKLLPYPTLALGLVGFALMLWLRLTGLDERGLIISSHPAAWLCWAVALAAAAVNWLCIRPLEGKMRYEMLFPQSPLGAVGNIVAALGTLVSSILSLGRWDTLGLVAGISGILACAGLGLIAHCRLRHHRPNFVAHFAVTAYLMLHLLLEYQPWSSQSQLLFYAFPMLASVMLTLSAYHATAFDVTMGSRKSYLFWGQMAGLCCLLALPFCDDIPFYLGWAVWAVTDLCSVRLPKAKEEPHEAP